MIVSISLEITSEEKEPISNVIVFQWNMRSGITFWKVPLYEMQNIRELGALSLEYWPEPDQRVKLTMIIGGEFAPESNLSILNLHIF